MSQPAHVRSIDAIVAFKSSLLRYRQRVQDALALLDTEMRRVLEWLEHDRPRYWQKEARRASEQLTQAKVELERCLMFPVADERPACREERAAVHAARARLDHCEDQVEAVRHAAREVRHELFQYQGRMASLSQTLEADVPRATALLERVLTALDKYQSVRAETLDPPHVDSTGASASDSRPPHDK